MICKNAPEPKAEIYSRLEYFFTRLESKCDEDKVEDVKSVRTLIMKLIKKYDVSISEDHLNPTLRMESCRSVVRNRNQFSISIYFRDYSNRYSNGVSGESSVRILYGYSQRKERVVVFKESKPME